MWLSDRSVWRHPVMTVFWAPIASDALVLLRPACDRRILAVRRPRAAKASSPPLVDDSSAPMGPKEVRERRPWRKTDVILPRHDLRERDHQRRQRNADNGLCGQAVWSWPFSERRACPPSPGLERVLYRDDAPVCASRLSRDLRQPLRARGGRQRRQP